MLALSLLALNLAAVLSKAVGVGDDFPGYQTFASKNISAFVEQGFLDNSGYDNTVVYSAMSQMCTSSASCDSFSVGSGASPNAFAADADATSYIKNDKCPSPGTAGPTVDGYLSCAGVDLNRFTPYVTFVLPPFLVKQSCDSAATCAGFSVNAAGTSGVLYSVVAIANHSSALKVTPPSRRDLATSEVVEVAAADPTDFTALPGVSLAAPAASVVFGPSSASPTAYVSTLMTSAIMTELCAANANCDVITDAPGADGTWSTWKLVPNAGVNTYLDATVCAVAGSLLKCTGLDATQGGTLLETYDLPSSIVSLASKVKGAHAYSELTDDSSGALYTFPAAAAGVSSYFKVPA